MTMSSLPEDISFRIRLVLDTSGYTAASSYYKNKRLDVLKLQSAHDTSNNTATSNDAEESVAVELSSKVSSFITYFIRKVYVGSNLSSSSSKRHNRDADLNHFKILIQSYAPELEEACLVYHVVGDANSFAEIRQGFRNAEAASTSTVKVVLCANESDYDLPIMPQNAMDTNSVGSGEVIDFVLSVKYGYRPGVSRSKTMKIQMEEESQEINEESDSDKVDDDEEGSEEEDSEGVSKEENDQIGNDNSDELESTDISQCPKLNNSGEAGSATVYPSE